MMIKNLVNQLSSIHRLYVSIEALGLKNRTTQRLNRLAQDRWSISILEISRRGYPIR